MWPTSEAFDEALARSSRVWNTRVEVLYAGSVAVTLNVVADGKVSIDDVAVRRSLNLTLVDAEGTLTPSDAKDLLSPKGTEIRIYKGLTLASGAVEEVPLGVFGITEPTVTAHRNGTIVKLRAPDRVDAVRKRRFDAPYPVASGTSTSAAIVAIVTSRLDVPYRIVDTGHTTPEVVFDELSDPWDAVRNLASADSLIAYFDPLGTFVVQPDTEFDTGVTYASGASSLLVDSQRLISAENTYSGVVVKGEHPDYPGIRYVLWDTDTGSPTYYLGPFGKRPYGFSSPLITTTGMAQTAAETILPRVTKMRQEIKISTVGHPGHDVGDVVTVLDPKSRTNGRYTVIGGDIPLRVGRIGWKLRSALT